MRTKAADVLKTNSASTWMSQIEQGEDEFRQVLMRKLAQVPVDNISKISGPRNISDISYLIWQKVKHKSDVDYENAMRVS